MFSPIPFILFISFFFNIVRAHFVLRQEREREYKEDQVSDKRPKDLNPTLPTTATALKSFARHHISPFAQIRSAKALAETRL
jgi:hypothetical protein